MPALVQSPQNFRPDRLLFNTSHSLAKGLVGAWPMTEGVGEKVNDLSGHRHHGTIVGGASWVNGRTGKCLNFDGTNHWVEFGNVDIAAFANEYLTISAWANQAASDSGYLISKDNSGGGWGVLINAGTLTYRANNATELTAASSYSTGVWNHFVLTNDTQSVLLYLNGIQVDIENTDRNSTANAGILYVGRSDAGGAADIFTGQIENVCLWNRPLTASQVRQLYYDPWGLYRPSRSQRAYFYVNSIRETIRGAVPLFPMCQAPQRWKPKPAIKNPDHNLSRGLVGAWLMNEGAGEQIQDQSGQVKHGSMIGPLWSGENRNGGACISFDGVDDYITISKFGFNMTFVTLSCWIKVTAFGGSPLTIMDLGQNTANVPIFETGRSITGSTGSLSWIIPSAVQAQTSTKPIIAGTWNHVVFCIAGTEANNSIYANGVSQPLATNATNSNSAAAFVKWIGRRGNSTNPFSGSIDDVRLWDRALTPDEVRQLYYEGY